MEGIGDCMNEYGLGFDTDFMSDEEVEAMLDAIVVATGSRAATDDSRTAIVNPERIRQVLYTYKVLKYMTRGTKAKVSYKLHAPYKSMGSVSVIGTDLTFSSPKWIMKAVELASNFEVYPKTDGTVQMNFTFHGLTMAID